MAVTGEQITALQEEIAALESDREKALMEFGEAALSELRDNKEFAESAAKIDEIVKQIGEKKEEETELLAEKAKQEKEERERIVKLTCFKCNKVNPEGAAFCETCGSKIGELPREYCKACGTMNQTNMKFCGECGSKLD